MTTSKIALVTGASTGIGRAVSEALVNAGFAVVGTSRDASRAKPLKGVTFLDLDVTNDESVTAAVAEVIKRFGRIDVLVNNAGGGASGAAEDSSVALDQRLFDLNVFGLMRVTKAVLPHMRRQGAGRIVNMSSVVGFMPAPFMAAYTATKHAVEGWSESLDHEVREYGIRVVLVQPAWTNTGFEANSVRPDQPQSVYAAQRDIADGIIVAAVKAGDAPSVVADTVVTAATDAKPKLRYAAGPTAGRVRTMRRFVPAGAFDKQLRKMNQLAG